LVAYFKIKVHMIALGKGEECHNMRAHMSQHKEAKDNTEHPIFIEKGALALRSSLSPP
jgi:hypothetical protein